MVSNVMQGYNGCCLAYGQTGAGKTHTMQGELALGPAGEPNPLRGLAPRVFEQVFEVCSPAISSLLFSVSVLSATLKARKK
jgi:kinesin family member 11